jgi:hypothetical protein
MSKISNQNAYPLANPADGSYIIGTDVTDLDTTKTYLFSGVFTYINEKLTDSSMTPVYAAEKVVQKVKFKEDVLKGEPVYITGYNQGQELIEVSRADSSNASHMPSFGLADDDYDLNSIGYIISSGDLNDLNTAILGAVGQTIYVAPGGGLTITKPTGSNLIQNVGTIARSNANNGSIEVSTIGRTNDVPNLSPGKIFVGSTGNTVESTSITLTESTGSVQLNQYGSGAITGTPAFNLGVDSSGNIIELPGGVIDGSGTENFLPIWIDSNTLGDSMASQDSDAVNPIFQIDARYQNNNYTAPTGSDVYKIKSGTSHKFSITQDGGGGVVLPSGDILNNGPSFNMGGTAFANGENALSVGASTTAFGNGSFAANFITLASGGGSSAFGLLTEASALASAAFGNKSKATGNYSIASGQDSIAEGQSSVAIGEKGVAQGKNTFVSGFGGTATGNNAAKFGYDGSASGNNSAKFGFESIASGNNSFASGWQTVASGLYSFTAGDGNIASGERTTAFGIDNNVSGKGSFAIGARNTAPSENSFVGGKDNTLVGSGGGASGSQTSFVFGASNSVSNENNIVLGENNITSIDNIKVLGDFIDTASDTIIDTNTSVALGDGRSSSSERYSNVAITDKTLRLGKADDIGATASNTTGILNFNDSVYANTAYSNVGGFVGYFPPPTPTNDYNFFQALSENVDGNVFQAGASPTASRITMSTSPTLNSIGYKFDANTTNGGGVYYTVSNNSSTASYRGIVIFDVRHQNQNYSVPNGHKLFEITSGYGQTKFEITQASGGGTANGAAALNFGKGNSSTGQASVAMGQNLTVSANQAFAAGINNSVASIYASAFGDSNNITTASFSSFVAGTNNSTNSKPKSIVLGQGLTSEDENAITLGRFNAVPTQNSIFVLGNGTASVSKSNAIEVTKVGSHIVLPVLQSSASYADDTAAAAGGVPVGGLYRNGNVVQIRLT